MRGPGDRGSASVHAAAAVAVVLLVTGMLLAVAVAHLASSRARAAADLAAVAAVGRLPPAVAGDPCRAAARVAERNGGRLLSCRPAGDEVVVVVEVDVALPGARSASATARAGLVPAVGSVQSERDA